MRLLAPFPIGACGGVYVCAGERAVGFRLAASFSARSLTVFIAPVFALAGARVMRFIRVALFVIGAGQSLTFEFLKGAQERALLA